MFVISTIHFPVAKTTEEAEEQKRLQAEWVSPFYDSKDHRKSYLNTMTYIRDFIIMLDIPRKTFSEIEFGII